MQMITLLATYGTIIEIFLILLLVAITLFMKLLYYDRAKRIQSVKNEIEDFLQDKINGSIQVTPESFQNRWKRLDILLAVIDDFDKTHLDDNWILIRANFIRSIVLPLAREAASSKDWQMRHNSAIAFSHYSENGDEKYVLQLINDTIPLVRYAAAEAGIVYGSEAVVNSIILQMSKEKWLTQTIYMHAFDNAPNATHYFLEKIIKNSKSSAVRATTYSLLLKYSAFEVEWDINADIKSKNIILLLSAIRYLAYIHREESSSELQRLLHHPDWKVRTVVIACIGDLNLTTLAPDVARYLTDENWWVRFAATQTLKKFGEVGEKQLSAHNVKSSEINIDVQQQVLDTF